MNRAPTSARGAATPPKLKSAVDLLRFEGLTSRYALFSVASGALSLRAAPGTRPHELSRLERATSRFHRQGGTVGGIQLYELKLKTALFGYVAFFADSIERPVSSDISVSYTHLTLPTTYTV